MTIKSGLVAGKANDLAFHGDQAALDQHQDYQASGQPGYESSPLPPANRTAEFNTGRTASQTGYFNPSGTRPSVRQIGAGYRPADTGSVLDDIQTDAKLTVPGPESSGGES